MTQDTLFLPGLSPVENLDLHARFDGGALSSDGGLLILHEIERRLKFADMLASCLHDERDPTRTIHSQATMIQERMFAICCGYEDCDDLDELRHDPVFKLACERLPDSGHALASQPTLSRLENAPTWRELARMAVLDSRWTGPGRLSITRSLGVPAAMAHSQCPGSSVGRAAD